MSESGPPYQCPRDGCEAAFWSREAVRRHLHEDSRDSLRSEVD